MNAVQRAYERKRGLRIAARFVADWEGGQSIDGLFRPYWDEHGQTWTQGYGHTEGVGRSSKPWTKDHALRVLSHDLDQVYGKAVAALGLPMRRHQFAAIVSAVYNLGVGVLEPGRSLGDALRARRWRKAADALLLYVKSGGVTLEGLQNRRAAERALFLKDLPPNV